MTKGQLAVIFGSLALFGVLYFGCETKTKNFNQERSLSIQNTSIDNLMLEAKSSLNAVQLQEIALLDQELKNSTTDSLLISNHKRLSAKWYDFGYPSIAGFHAEEIAKLENTEEAWSMTGTTYNLCIRNAHSQKERDYCTEKAVEAFENSISINPDNISNRINLSLAYVDNPPKDNPMKGILLLRALNESNPQNVQVLNQLARLAIRTGQNQRAIERLTTVLSIENENPIAICLIAQAYENNGEAEKATVFKQKCSEIKNSK